MPHRDYSHQDLRNRSFNHQDLTGANFSYANLRGCDFSEATLTRANFQGCRTGQSRKQIIGRFVDALFGIFFFNIATTQIVGSTTGVIAIALIGVFVVGSAVVGSPVYLAASTIASGIIFAFLGLFAVSSVHASSAISAFIQGMLWEGTAHSIMALLPFSCAVYVLFHLVKISQNAIGTIFKGADLSHANFSQAWLVNTSFIQANTEFINWTEAQLSGVKFPRHFEDNVIALCVSRIGRGQNYRYANLKNLDLREVDLTDGVLLSANLNGVNLSYANLANADLSNAQALGTDFSAANLTGACIQNWGINSDTQFTNIRCDYIYLETGQRERKPASGSFQPGDFEKLVHQFTKTLDFLFRNGIDPEAFDFALKNLLINYEDADLSLHSLIDVGGGKRLVRFNKGNPNVDPGAMHAQFFEDVAFMQIQLGEAREQNHLLEKDLAHVKGQIAIYEKHDTLLSIVLGRPTISIQDSQIGEFMSDKGNKVKIGRIGGDASGISGGDNSGVAGKNITGAAGGDISGTLTIALDQLSASQDPKALELVDLLKQVKTAIEKSDSGLSDADQQKALKHLETIGKLATDPKNPDLLEKAGDALDALPTIIKRGNNLADFAEKYLPTFTAGVKAIFSFWGVPL